MPRNENTQPECACVMHYISVVLAFSAMIGVGVSAWTTREIVDIQSEVQIRLAAQEHEETANAKK